MDLYSAARSLSKPFQLTHAQPGSSLGIAAHGLIGDGFSSALVRVDGEIAHEERDILVRLPRARRDELLGLTVNSPTGVRCTVGDVARLVPHEGAREIFRRDQRRVARVTARIAPGLPRHSAISP